MNAIEAMRLEMEYQLHDLPRLVLPNATSDNNNNCLLAGSGDSYAAALIAEYFSDKRAQSCYPTDIILNPNVANGRKIYFISISGNTQANILAAQAAKKKGGQTVAITAKPDSKLARACDDIFELNYNTAGVPTAGTISFTSSVLACLSPFTKLEVAKNLAKVYRQAKNDAQIMVEQIIKRDSIPQSYLVLGNSMMYTVAMYAALKFNEVLGARAFAYPVEEFCHSPLFGMKSNDQVIIIGTASNENDVVETRLNESLRKAGFSSYHATYGKDVSSNGGTTIFAAVDSILYSIFLVQHTVLGLAEGQGFDDCYFLKNQELLGISSELIYGNV